MAFRHEIEAFSGQNVSLRFPSAIALQAVRWGTEWTLKLLR